MNQVIAETCTIIQNHKRSLGYLFLVLVILAAYRDVTTHAFVSFDDTIYVTENIYVQRGLTTEGIKWAFGLSNTQNTYWHPLTWLSHMLDCHIFGMNAGGHHFTNLAIHVLNCFLLLFIFDQMTRAWWPSFVVATLFALHPLNVDSVAWVAERKNVLSTFFWLLTLLAYIRYCKKTGVFRYLAVTATFCLGLLSKPMLVTLPFVLLLLDYWPLCRTREDLPVLGHPVSTIPGTNRFRQNSFSKLVMEKFPLFILSGLSVYLSLLSLKNLNLIVSAHQVPLDLRLANALVSYTDYIFKTIYPVKLAIFYPYPTTMPPFWQIAGAGLLFFMITVLSVRAAKRRPYLLIGWLWFTGTLLPVSGLVQGGLWPSMADRWTYIPNIGLFLIIAWGTPDLLPQGRHRKIRLAAIYVISVACLTVMTWKQVGYWKNSTTLFSHAVAATSDNPVAHNNLGNALLKQGQINAAIDQFQKVLQLKSYSVEIYRSMGNAYVRNNQADKAIAYYQEALRINPDDEKTFNNLGNLFIEQRQYTEAIRQYLQALLIKPDYVKAHNNIAIAYLKTGDRQKAITHFKKAIRINPNYAAARYHLDRLTAFQAQPQETPE